MRQIMHSFWESETAPEEWEHCLLSILAKKGDLSSAGNYRGIMMLEVGSKIVAIVLDVRLTPICESLDHETQCGFRPGRGTADASFTLKQVLRKAQAARARPRVVGAAPRPGQGVRPRAS